MIFRAHTQGNGHYSFGVAVFNRPDHVGIYIDLIFFYLMFEFKKKG